MLGILCVSLICVNFHQFSCISDSVLWAQGQSVSSSLRHHMNRASPPHYGANCCNDGIILYYYYFFFFKVGQFKMFYTWVSMLGNITLTFFTNSESLILGMLTRKQLRIMVIHVLKLRSLMVLCPSTSWYCSLPLSVFMCDLCVSLLCNLHT